ncbi:MAG: DUF350 domain-containing protein [Candidatus Kapabacteria bacterium]|jgi:uncharacterized membrane protein YjfL (UPF0719 family)|nr:DUF350 domain-containing protein [Candidatus Kapabacteria bacterium]
MNWQATLEGTLFIGGATIVLLIVARFINQFVMSVHLTESLVHKDNPAMGVQIAGYILGMMMIVAAVLTGEGSGTLLTDARDVGIYGITGLLVLALSSSLLMRVFVSGTVHESVRDGNVAAGITTAGSYVATAAVIAACVAGDARGGNYVTALVFMLAGFVALLLITFIFRRLTAYDDVQEILGGNIPAAMSYAGLMIAVGIIVGHAAKGDFVDYLTSFTGFGKTLLAVIALYPIRQFLVQGVLLGSGFSLYGGGLDTEISRDRNINAGIIEAVSYIGAALLIAKVG